MKFYLDGLKNPFEVISINEKNNYNTINFVNQAIYVPFPTTITCTCRYTTKIDEIQYFENVLYNNKKFDIYLEPRGFLAGCFFKNYESSYDDYSNLINIEIDLSCDFVDYCFESKIQSRKRKLKEIRF